MKKELYVVPSHKYGLGTFINNVQGSVTDGKYTGGLFSGMSEGLGNAMGAIGSAVGGVAGGLIGGGRTSAAGDIIGGLGKAASAIPGPWGAIAGVGLGAISGLTNAAFGVKLNQENINAVNNNITAMNSFQSNAGSFDALAQNFMNQPTSMRFNQNFIGKNGWFNKGATRKYNELVAQQDAAQQFVDNSLINNMNNITTTQNQNLLANYAALGGPLSSHGTDWNTGLNYVGNGGSHEENPYDGVPMGIAPDGLPNLVEEGEVIWNNDYVFSKRLKVPKAVRRKYKLGGLKPLSFADAVMKVNKEAEERPNDPITLRGRDAILGALAEVQDMQRAKKEAKEQPEGMPMLEGIQPMVAANGGLLGHKFKNAGPKPNVSDDAANLFRLYWTRLDQNLSKDRSSILNWDNIPWTLSGNDTDAWNRTVDELKKKYKDLPESDARQKRAEDLIAIANRGKEGPISRTINDVYNAYIGNLNNTANTDYKVSEYYPMRLGVNNYWPDETFFMGEGFYNTPETSPTGEAAARQRWEDTKGKDVPTGLALATYRPPLATAPISPDTVVQGTNGVYDLTPQGSSSSNKVKGKGNKIKPSLASNLRYIPAIGAGIGVLSDLFGWTNKPDYSQADAIAKAARGMGTISTSPIGDYLTYRPMDRMFALNILNANAGANRRAILDTAGGNRGTAMAGLLASDNNTLNNIGNLFRQAEEYNAQQREKVATFNRATNMYNSELDFNTQKANLGRDEVVMRGLQAAAAMRDSIDQRVGAAKSANLTNLFESLGDIGREAAIRNMINSNPAWMYDIGWDGIVDYARKSNGGKIKNKKGKK